MTDEELKKKIIEVIDCLWIDYPPESGEVADALIDAGIGDVSAYKDKKLSSVNTSLEKLSKDDIIWAYQMLETSAKAEIERLTIENARLKARLKNAVELPCKVGDKVFAIVGLQPSVEEFVVTSIEIRKSVVAIRIAGFVQTTVFLSQLGKTWFTDLEAAEARLKELQGENSNADNRS